ncbi:hypothetical protein GGR22_000719 [Flavobacterium gossypii]|uniref:Uncharacterized protein n=1 Tax=Flavobacterium gossypii TaxID=1646119 RepID=A0ABR6DMC2_9FLAO|nr:hypothetical protein [Flavobacterium gossypii]
MNEDRKEQLLIASLHIQISQIRNIIKDFELPIIVTWEIDEKKLFEKYKNSDGGN